MQCVVTPPGQESRITRALKAYHISKANSPSDLPAWLFDEKERGLTSRLAATGRQSPDGDPRNITGDYDAREVPPPPRAAPKAVPMPSRGATTNGRPEYKKVYADEEDRQNMSRATQRLKELRDAKALPRKQTIRFADSVHPRRAQATDIAKDDRDVWTAPHVSPVDPVPMNRDRDVSAKRPVARGLPSGVRPMGRM